jgi:hypothetical protein
MNDKRPDSIIPTGGGFIRDLALRVKLILRLMGDPRVSPLVKLLPLGSALYLLFPDLAPGPIDDAAIIWLGFYLFVELCPQDVVQEHIEELSGDIITGEWRDISANKGKIIADSADDDPAEPD